jgi:hypothetical protein
MGCGGMVFLEHMSQMLTLVINDDFITNVNYNLPYALGEVQFR